MADPIADQTTEEPPNLMSPTCIRMPTDLLARLKTLSHTESLRTGRDMRWSDLVRDACKQYLARIEAANEPVDQDAPRHAKTEVSPAQAGAPENREFEVDPGADSVSF